MGSEIVPKDDYYELTDKMRAIVDAKARHPEATSQKLADIASDTLPEGETVSESYVRVVLRKQSHIVDERVEQVMNQRYEGEVQTEIDGDPFESDLERRTGWQLITDRPVKRTQTTEVSSHGGNGGPRLRVESELSQETVEEILREGNVPEEVYTSVLTNVVRRAF